MMLGEKWPQTASPSNFVKGHGGSDIWMSLKIKLSLLKFSPIFPIWVNSVFPMLSCFPIHFLLLPWQGEKKEKKEVGLCICTPHFARSKCSVELLIIHGMQMDLQGPQPLKKRESERNGLPETVTIPILFLIQIVTVQSFAARLLRAFSLSKRLCHPKSFATLKFKLLCMFLKYVYLCRMFLYYY